MIFRDSFGEFALSPEQRRVEHLIAFSNGLTDAPWAYDDDVVVAKGGGSLTLHGVASWSRHGGQCVLDAQGYFSHQLMSNGEYGKFIPAGEYVSLSGADGSWRSERSHLTGSDQHVDNGRASDTATLELYDLGTGELDRKTSSLGLVLAGADQHFWPTAFPSRNGGVSVDGVVATIFGRDALIRRMPTKTAAGNDMLVAFDGAPLEKRQQNALWIVLSFLAGRRVRVVGEIGIEGEREIWCKRHMWNESPHKAQPPLGPERLHEMSTVLPRMLDNALALLDEGNPLDIALAHLFADSRGNLDIEMRDVTLALDALVEASAFVSNGVTIVDPNEYGELLPVLEQALDEALQGHERREDLLKRLSERLKGANDVSHGERRRKFWKRIGFELKPDEKDALDNRHPMSHGGYLLRGAGDEEYKALLRQTRLARNLMNRVILALLGYDGPVFDYTSGKTEPWQYYIDRDGSRAKKQ
jgi:hypothetical protein